MARTLRAFIHSMRPVVLRWVAQSDAVSQSACDLIELIDDQAI